MPKEPGIEQAIAKVVVTAEYELARSNSSDRIQDFEQTVDLLECERKQKDYDWMSDIFLPEFPAHVLTQSAIDASQYFQTRDFVDVYLEDGSPESKLVADAAREIINRTLNQKHLNYYMKFMRAKINNTLGGYVFARCWWEQETMPYVDYTQSGEPVVKKAIKKDRFNFDVLDPRNVFTDNTYTYSIQEKPWITVRFEKTLDQLKADANEMGYEYLEGLEEISPPLETETSRTTYNKDSNETPFPEPSEARAFDVIERHGKFWAIVEERDPEDGYPTKIEPGVDRFGKVRPNAEYVDTIITFVLTPAGNHLIRFQPNPYRDADGASYKPFLRGLAYIHPTKDFGLGDGKFSRELQVAINDTFNISNDRVRLATLPTLKGKKFAVEDNDTLYFEPQHVMELDDPNDLVEFAISDNIQGAMAQLSMLIGQMQQATATYPTTMGRTPEVASTTATAVAGAEGRTNTRTFYKSLTFEHTFLTDLYWMILQMTYQFAKPETGLKLAGDKIYQFDPMKDYVYKPVSQSVETEYAKATKIKNYITLLSYIVQLPNPKTASIANHILARIFELFGDEYEEFGAALLDEQAPVNQEQAGIGQSSATAATPTSNQTGIPQSALEQTTRGAQYGL